MKIDFCTQINRTFPILFHFVVHVQDPVVNSRNKTFVKSLTAPRNLPKYFALTTFLEDKYVF